jgi:hypothetical protein
MKILKFKEYEKNTLRGFIDVEMPSGMIVKGLTWHKKEDGEKVSEWLGLPAREYTKEDGSKGYANQVDFVTRNLYWDFVLAVLDALKAHLKAEKQQEIQPDTEPEQEARETPF